MFRKYQLKSIRLGFGLVTLMMSSLLMASSNPFKQVAISDLNSEKLLLTHHVYVPDIAADQSEPRLKIYTDGLVVLTYPPYFKKRGSYQSWIDTKQLSSLSRLLTAPSAPSSLINQSQEESTSLADGRILMHASSAEKYDIIRHTLSNSPSQMAAQFVIKQQDTNAPHTRDLVDMLNVIALNTYTSNNK